MYSITPDRAPALASGVSVFILSNLALRTRSISLLVLLPSNQPSQTCPATGAKTFHHNFLIFMVPDPNFLNFSYIRTFSSC